MARRPRARWLGDDRGGLIKTVPSIKDPDKIDIYTVFWRDLDNKEKGTIWIYHSASLMKEGGFQADEDIPWRLKGQSPSIIRAKGKKWEAIYSSGERYKFLSSPMATKAIMADIAKRWKNPPHMLKPESGSAFAVKTLDEDTSSYVYLVQLMTFDMTISGRSYYKIGKARSIPKRIKQFGPCRLLASLRLQDEESSLRAEARLHKEFASLRRPDTEIFCMNDQELQRVVAEFDLYDATTQAFERCSSSRDDVTM
ncbi:hypothetical protein EVJ50_03930 [Synechococcus sp. RSCCF101]|uniref:GIY-YIG nuclease family protein n=1 Tax=Synechococcus sp. RSCCF101 TaxID=2511069 RepID=UPI00124427AD|nr:GIY-YIG nuclease family protein [Synechococcus sp. RSCCF101]QEY31526.1 hypothetical protein EVJ50_03930 [Synechococcus sp. RSCCF101]